MGIFSFLKNSGATLFTGNEEVDVPKPTETSESNLPDAIRKQRISLLEGIVIDLGIYVNDLFIDVVNETVIVKGEVESQADKERIILALGNVRGISRVDDQMIVSRPASEAQFYEVKKGDSLSKIAKEFYGDAMKYPVIFEANKPMLKDPNLIYPGQVLRIPPIGDV